MAAGVKVQLHKPEFATAGKFIDERRKRTFPLLRIRLPEVDKVGIVGENLLRTITERLAIRPERRDRLRGERRGAPLALIFRKHGECGRP